MLIEKIQDGTFGPFIIQTVKNRGKFRIYSDGQPLKALMKMGLTERRGVSFPQSIIGTSDEAKLLAVMNDFISQEREARNYTPPKLCRIFFEHEEYGCWKVEGAIKIYRGLTGIRTESRAKPIDADSKAVYLTHRALLDIMPKLIACQDQVLDMTGRKYSIEGLNLYVSDDGSGVAIGPYANLFKYEGVSLPEGSKWRKRGAAGGTYGLLYCDSEYIQSFFDGIEDLVVKIPDRAALDSVSRFKEFIEERVNPLREVYRSRGVEFSFDGPYLKIKIPYGLIDGMQLIECGFVWVPQWSSWCYPMDRGAPEDALRIFGV